MTDDLDSLILDLLERLGSSPRPYSEVLDAWQTSCPRLPVWEHANDRGFVECQHDPGRGRAVSVSTAGAEYLRNNRVRARASKAPSVGDGDPRPRSPATSPNIAAHLFLIAGTVTFAIGWGWGPVSAH